MPKELERRLKAEAKKRWPKDQEHQDRYVYGTLTKLKKNQELGRETQKLDNHDTRGKSNVQP